MVTVAQESRFPIHLRENESRTEIGRSYIVFDECFLFGEI